MGNGKLPGLTLLLERHSGAVRSDLARYYNGLNLNALFRGEYTPDEVWELLMHLPRDSATIAAIADDDELVGDVDSIADPKPPRLTEFGPEVEALATIADRLGALLAAVTSLGGQSVRIEPYPRPVTAADRARKAAARRAHRKLVAQLIPGKEEVTADGHRD